MSTLDEILNESEEAPKTEAAAVEPAAVEVSAAEPTGEEAAPPAVVEDPVEVHRKGLEAATVAERTRRQAAEQRAEALEAKIKEFERQAAPKPEVDVPPDPNEYQDRPQEYWAKLARYEARQELKAERAKDEEQAQQRQQQQSAQAFKTAAANVIDAGRSEFADFDAVVNAGLGPFMTPVIHQAVVTSKDGQKLAYHLGKNPGEAAEIAKLDPVGQLMALGELRAKLSTPAKATFPQTLTDSRDAKGRFVPVQTGPTPLSAILNRQ